MIPFYSEHNQVYPVLYHGMAAVEKHFRKIEDWQREMELYATLGGKLPVLTVLHTSPGVLVTRYCSLGTLSAVLDDQQAKGFDPVPWLSLCRWLSTCYALCGLLPVDGNLRNFFWDGKAGAVVGLDLEYLFPWDLPSCGANFIAFLLYRTPGDAPLKQAIVKTLTDALRVPADAIAVAAKRQQDIHQAHPPVPFSGIVLANGQTRPTAPWKGALDLSGKSLLQWQVEKLQSLEIGDIMIYGENCPKIPNTRSILSVDPPQGPLDKLCACVGSARYDQCLVVSADVPLIPPSALSHLCKAHTGGVTVLRHGGQEEPLIAVYDRATAQAIAPDGHPAALKNGVSRNVFDYLGPEELLQRCVTPVDYDRLTALAEAYRSAGLPLF